MNEEIKKYTQMFHNTYEMLSPKFNYETRKDTKKFDFDTPNGKLMYATVEKIILPILKENQKLKEQLEASEKARKEAIDKLKTLGKFDGEKCTRSSKLWTADFNELISILDIDKGE